MDNSIPIEKRIAEKVQMNKQIQTIINIAVEKIVVQRLKVCFNAGRESDQSLPVDECYLNWLVDIGILEKVDNKENG